MHRFSSGAGRFTGRCALVLRVVLTLLTLAALAAPLMAQEQAGGEANLKLPDLNQASFLGGIGGRTLLMGGLAISALGLVFGLMIFVRLKNMAVHSSMREVSELIYETCKTYLATQGKFLMILELFIAVIIVFYFGFLQAMEAYKVVIILLFSVVGISGSFCVAAFGMRVNTFANSRTAFASLTGKAYPCYDIPLQAGMSIGMLLVSVELLIMLFILLFVPGDLAGSCFIGFAIGESLGAAALRVAGGIFTKIADIGSDLMKIVFKIKEDDVRNPGVIADCTGDNAGDSVGPSADGFETYGVTGVALITFILLAVPDPMVQVQLLVWIFAMRVMMVISSGIGYFINGAIAKARYSELPKMNFEAPLTTLVWLTSILSIVLTYIVSAKMIPTLGGDDSLWWKLSTVISCGTLAGALIPEFVKVFTSTHSRHVREIVTSSREGGASLNILSGFVAGNFSAFWLGMTMMSLMAVAYAVSTTGLGVLMMKPEAAAVFAFGLVAFGFLGMGPVTIAVDSYGPVTDNAQSVYELSMIETLPNIEGDIQKNFGFKPEFERAKENLEENDGAGNTFKATSKPVLIGTAVVGATTMIFSTIVALTHGLTTNMEMLSLMHAPFLLGLITGGAVIYWFTGASTQAVTTGAYRAVEFIKANIKLESQRKGVGCGFEKSGRHLHPIRAEGYVEHLPDGVLRNPGIRVRRALLLHRLSDLHRALRPVSGAVHGQCRRRLGQRQEGRGDRTASQRHAAARRHGGGRYGRRSVQGHQLGGAQPDHQIHHAVRPTGGVVGGRSDAEAGRRFHEYSCGRVPGDRDIFRVSKLLRNAY